MLSSLTNSNGPFVKTKIKSLGLENKVFSCRAAKVLTSFWVIMPTLLMTGERVSRGPCVVVFKWPSSSGGHRPVYVLLWIYLHAKAEGQLCSPHCLLCRLHHQLSPVTTLTLIIRLNVYMKGS